MSRLLHHFIVLWNPHPSQLLSSIWIKEPSLTVKVGINLVYSNFGHFWSDSMSQSKNVPSPLKNPAFTYFQSCSWWITESRRCRTQTLPTATGRLMQHLWRSSSFAIFILKDVLFFISSLLILLQPVSRRLCADSPHTLWPVSSSNLSSCYWKQWETIMLCLSLDFTLHPSCSQACCFCCCFLVENL